MSSAREIWGIRTRDQIFTPTPKGALDEDRKKQIFEHFKKQLFTPPLKDVLGEDCNIANIWINNILRNNNKYLHRALDKEKQIEEE